MAVTVGGAKKDDQAGGYYGYFHYEDVVSEVKSDLMQSVALALSTGVPRTALFSIGIGFGKTGAQSMTADQSPR